MDLTLVRTAACNVYGDFTDPVKVWNDFIYHVAALKGVTILGTLKHDFTGLGFSGLIMLGESHAAIHTFPEKGVAWIELATCGDPESLKEFVKFKAPTIGGLYVRDLVDFTGRE